MFLGGGSEGGLLFWLFFSDLKHAVGDSVSEKQSNRRRCSYIIRFRLG